MEKEYPCEYVRLIAEGRTAPPNHLHRVVLETLVLVLVVVASKEQSIVAHLHKRQSATL